MTIRSFIMFVQILGIAILTFEFVFAVCQKPSEMQKHIIVLTIAAILMYVGYLLELRADCLHSALAATAISYIGKPYIMLSSYLFIKAFYGKKFPTWLTALLNIYCAGFSVLVYTNNYHHLYYASTEYIVTDAFSPLVITRGPLYYSYMITAVLYFIACIVAIYRGMKSTTSKRIKKQSIWLIILVISGVGGYLIYLTGITNGYDSTLLGIFFGVVCLFILFVRHKILDVLSIAKEHALEDSSTGLLVVNEENQVVYQNSLIEELIKNEIPTDYLLTIDKQTTIYNSKEKVYSIEKKDLKDGNTYLGKSLEVKDITDSYHYQERLENEVKERTEKLEVVQRSIISSVASIIEARSAETGEHVKRTSAYVKMAINGLRKHGYYLDELSDEFESLLVSAAPLHDIGKISISDTILLKPGKLTSQTLMVKTLMQIQL